MTFGSILQNYFAYELYQLYLSFRVSFQWVHIEAGKESRRCTRKHNLVIYNFMNNHFDFYLNGNAYALPETILLHLVESKIRITK